MRGARRHVAWWAFLVQRVSGIALSVFLPMHFYVLGMALEGEERLDGFLRWSDQPLVIAGEWLIVVLLAAHLVGGLRVMALEMLPWRSWQKTLAALAAGVALLAGLAFALAR